MPGSRGKSSAGRTAPKSSDESAYITDRVRIVDPHRAQFGVSLSSAVGRPLFSAPHKLQRNALSSVIVDHHIFCTLSHRSDTVACMSAATEPARLRDPYEFQPD